MHGELSRRGWLAGIVSGIFWPWLGRLPTAGNKPPRDAGTGQEGGAWVLSGSRVHGEVTISTYADDPQPPGLATSPLPAQVTTLTYDPDAPVRPLGSGLSTLTSYSSSPEPQRGETGPG
jgi:hypothetical protein